MLRRICKNGAQNLQITQKKMQFFGAEFWRPYT